MAARVDLETRNPTLAKQMSAMFAALGNCATWSTNLQKQTEKLITENGSLVAQYNALLTSANSMLVEANARLARQQRINNALAIYSMMPKYQPVQLPPPPVFAPALQINCTSRTMGTTVYTDCH